MKHQKLILLGSLAVIPIISSCAEVNSALTDLNGDLERLNRSLSPSATQKKSYPQKTTRSDAGPYRSINDPESPAYYGR